MIRTLLGLVCAGALLHGADNLAVAIGISEYAHVSGSSSPKHARSDALDFARYVSTEDESAVLASNARLLTDSAATREAIESALEWLSSRSSRQDQIFFYFSGRVATDTSGQLYILPWETLRDSSSGIGIDEILGYLRNRVRARQVTLFIEAYRGGEGQAIIPSSVRRQLDERGKSEASGDPPAAGLEPAMILLASSPEEYLREDNDVERGVFTLYLLEGLRGRADQDLDGVVSTGELRRYVSDALAFHTDGQQHPMVLPGFQPGAGLTRSRVVQSATGDLTTEEAAAIRRQSRKDDGAEVFFAANSDVAAAGISSVVRLANLLKRDPDHRCVLEGHADASETSPMLRSQQRVLSVRALLLQLGVKPEQIGTATLGASQPRSNSASGAGQLVNRRVTAKVHTSRLVSYSAPSLDEAKEAAQAGLSKAVVREYFPRERLPQLLSGLGDPVFFASNSASVVNGIPGLLELANRLTEHHDLECTLTGHADISENGWDALSLGRATAVREFLLESGAPPDRVKAEAVGLTSPIAPSLYDTGRLLNRRVAITVTTRPRTR